MKIFGKKEESKGSLKSIESPKKILHTCKYCGEKYESESQMDTFVKDLEQQGFGSQKKLNQDFDEILDKMGYGRDEFIAPIGICPKCAEYIKFKEKENKKQFLKERDKYFDKKSKTK